MALKQKIKLLVLLVLLSSGVIAQTSAYRYQLKIGGVTKNWHSIRVPNSVYPLINSTLEDLRIYGFKSTDTIEIPYLLEKSADQLVEREINFKTINESQNADGYYFTFQATDLSAINQVQLAFEQSNFDWKASLEGSSNNKQWFNLLADQRIVSIKNSRTSYRFTQLDFPVAKYEYFRLRIKAEVKPKLTAAKILKTDTLKGINQPILNFGYALKNEPKLKQTVIELTLPAITPISDLKLNIADEMDFYRSAKIEYATDSVKTEKGLQYNYVELMVGDLSSLEIPKFDFKGTFTKKIRITIENDDNQPLSIPSVSINATVYELIARFTRPDYQYFLYVSNEHAKAPVYDLKNFENRIPMEMSPLDLGKLTVNPKFHVKESQPFFKNKLWIWALMGVIIAILGFFTLKILRESK